MFAQPGVVTEEGELSGGMKFKQPRQEQAAEQFATGHGPAVQKGRPGRHPALCRLARCCHRARCMWMCGWCVIAEPQGVEHGGEANARAEMTPVSGDGQHGLRRRPEQQVQNDRYVLESDVGDYGGGRP